MLGRLFQAKGKGFVLTFIVRLGRELLDELPLPLVSKLADGKLTPNELRELVVLIGGEAAMVFQEVYRENYGEPQEVIEGDE